MKLKRVCCFISVSALLSCAPMSKVNGLKVELTDREIEITSLQKINQENQDKFLVLTEKLKNALNSSNILRLDTAILLSEVRNLEAKNKLVNEKKLEIENSYKALLIGTEKDYQGFSKTLILAQDDLLKKQDEIKQLSDNLDKKLAEFNKLNNEFKMREARVVELEETLKKKDQAVLKLRKTMRDALIGFEDKGLAISIKDGKVYLRLDESLLFESGKYKLEPKGTEVLKKIAKILEENEDINIIVEGHTDDVPMKSHGDIKDNWDLSVIRANAVTKIILSNGKIIGARITSAGRGEFVPMDSAKTTEARKKNRRIEIILTPKLDSLFSLIDTN